MARREGDERFWPHRPVGLAQADPRGRARGHRFWRGDPDRDGGLDRADAWLDPADHWTDRAYAGRPLVGPHVGKGPRGWRRSDRDILEEVCERLTHDPEVDALQIEVRVDDGEVTLLGAVADRAQKRRAEICAEGVRGVYDVHNRLRIVGRGP